MAVAESELGSETAQQRLTLGVACVDHMVLNDYISRVGVDSAYQELFETYENVLHSAETLDKAFFAIGNKMHEAYEDEAPMWVDLLAKQREQALRWSAVRRQTVYRGVQRIFGDYRSGDNYPQDLYNNG